MASIISHIAVPICARLLGGPTQVPRRLFLLALLASILPDADVIAFKFGIPYASDYGHRGFTHSIAFALVLAAVCAACFRALQARPAVIFSVIFVSCLSHALLDALTNGGLGVALFWPLDSARIFLPWVPIEVSPIGVTRFFTERGLLVLWSEAKIIWLPCALTVAIGLWLKRRVRKGGPEIAPIRK
ncbi:metal-dependent hydrolase [Simiduia sp. 21SJ11W-1]|uniref:metal-dependent hydrolase n=1 Tax=Simiduia sp. 21SJ11W-1 TaxID=2909669 RepID=UPI0020A15BAC|nr:metal-dependent hydrolase [Simiduia sp. 21SJ11W-1]UTA47264.1 metal-dependent hydrolase [Simiduia sp. 21SJ11W-1]